VFVVSESIHPDDKTNATDEVAVIAGGLDRWYTAHALEIVGIALMVGAVLGLAHLLHERSPGYAVVGGGLALIGLVVLAVQLWRTRVVASWQAGAIALGAVAVAASMTNIVSGFLITDRMLKMFRERRPRS
jgi:hypothetical protein